MPERIYTLQSSRSFLKTNADPSTTNGCDPLQIPTFLKVGALLRLAKRSGINKAMIEDKLSGGNVPHQIRRSIWLSFAWLSLPAVINVKKRNQKFRLVLFKITAALISPLRCLSLATIWKPQLLLWLQLYTPKFKTDNAVKTKAPPLMAEGLYAL